MMNAAKVLGTTDSVTACECCGRADLKGTVALSFGGEAPVYFGAVCAAKAAGRPAKAIKAEAASADREAAREAARAASAAFQAKADAFEAFLAAHGTGADTAERLRSLGGFAAARRAFAAR